MKKQVLLVCSLLVAGCSSQEVRSPVIAFQARVEDRSTTVRFENQTELTLVREQEVPTTFVKRRGEDGAYVWEVVWHAGKADLDDEVLGMFEIQTLDQPGLLIGGQRVEQKYIQVVLLEDGNWRLDNLP